MRSAIVFALLALAAVPSVACVATPDDAAGESADAVVGLPSEENAEAKGWSAYAAKAIVQAEKDYAAADASQIRAVAFSEIPSPVLDKYSRESTRLKAFLLKVEPGLTTFKYALLEVPPTANRSFTRIVFVMRGIGPYAGREIGTCLAASGRPLASCAPAP
jgi:hypothetical protein